MKPFISINNFLLVEGFKHNLLSISQLCNNGSRVLFNKDQCIINKKYEIKLFSTNRQWNLCKIEYGPIHSM